MKRNLPRKGINLTLNKNKEFNTRTLFPTKKKESRGGHTGVSFSNDFEVRSKLSSNNL